MKRQIKRPAASVVVALGLAVSMVSPSTASSGGGVTAEDGRLAAGFAPKWTELAPPSSPSARWSGKMVYDSADHELVMFGGYGEAFVRDTWLWDGATWTLAHSSDAPDGRMLHFMAYDPVHDEVVLFGGGQDTETSFSDTWTFKNGQWTEQHPATHPSSLRRYGAMAYDPISKTVLLQGYGQTWAWDGTAWTQLHPSESPPNRSGGSLAYDPVHHGLIRFGGHGGAQYRHDSWIWDGTTWAHLKLDETPSGRVDSAMVTMGRHVVLFGGAGHGDETLNDTWILRKHSWRELDPRDAPSGRARGAMGYDAAHHQMILFGGAKWYGGSGPVLKDTWAFNL